MNTATESSVRSSMADGLDATIAEHMAAEHMAAVEDMDMDTRPDTIKHPNPRRDR